MRRISLLAALLFAAVPLFAATEPNPTPRQRELTEQLLIAMKVNSALPSMMDSMFAQIEKQFLGGNDTDDESLAEAKEGFALFRERAAKTDFAAILHEAFIRIYAKHFSESELADLVSFYASPTGLKMIDAMPLLMRDGMQAGVELVSPKIEKLMSDVRDEQEKMRPWRRTMRDMEAIAAAVESYATDHDAYPAGDLSSLGSLLIPTYAKQLPEKDMWGHPYAYVVSADHKQYRIASAGADSNFEWDTLRIGAPAKTITYRERLEDDIIYAAGDFIQLPIQAKPKKTDAP
jgi:hypothetical protein